MNKMMNNPESSEGHGFFRAAVMVNLFADAAMSFYSAACSQNSAVTVGMIVLGVFFVLGAGGMLLLRINMKRSSCMLAGAAYLLLNIMIGGVFAGEFFDIFPRDFLRTCETAAAVIAAADIVITVNVLVKRKIDGEL